VPLRLFIFECSNATQPECFERNLFGSSARWPAAVKPNELCLLYNFQSGFIYGLYRALTKGTRGLVPDAWASLYPWQVQVQLCSKERLGVPRFNIEKLVRDPDTGRARNVLYGEPAQNLIQNFASDVTWRYLRGEASKTAEDDYRMRFPRRHHCIDGHDVRSLSEQAIDDWLSRNQVYHEYERLINIPEQLIPDFTVYTPDEKPVYIEYWGLLDDPEYVSRKNRKCEIYARYRFPVLEFHQHELQNLDFYMRQKLREVGIVPRKA
jgi:hypothetical protein